MNSAPPAPRSGSRTVFIVLGVLGLCVLCCCGGGGVLAYLGVQRGKVDDTAAKAFARTALLAGADWKPASIHPYLSRTWTSGMDAKKEAALFDTYARKVGKLRELGEFTSSSFFYGNQNGLPTGTRIKMSAPAKFDKGEGTISVGMAKIDGKWGIENLKIDSDAFLK